MAVEFCHGCGETHVRCSILAYYVFRLTIFTGVGALDVSERYLLSR